MLSPNFLTEMDRIVALYETRRAALLPLLHLAQKHCGAITPEVEDQIGRFLQIPVIRVREVVSFYTLLRREPAGKSNYQVCCTLTCWLAGSEQVLEHLKNKLGIEPGQTSADGSCSLCSVECLGACEKAPVMQLNDEYVGNLTPKEIDEITARPRGAKGGKANSKD